MTASFILDLKKSIVASIEFFQFELLHGEGFDNLIPSDGFKQMVINFSHPCLISLSSFFQFLTKDRPEESQPEER